MDAERAKREVDVVRPIVSRLREIAYDLKTVNHSPSSQKVNDVADELRLVAAEIDRRVGRE